MGIVLWIIQLAGVEDRLSGEEVLLGVISTYVLAFVQAGASVFNQIESWPIAKRSATSSIALLGKLLELSFIRRN